MHDRRFFLQRSGLAAGALALPYLLSGGADAAASACCGGSGPQARPGRACRWCGSSSNPSSPTSSAR
jgi:hypothetical protein